MYNNGQRRRMIELFNLAEGRWAIKSSPKFTQKLSLSGLWNLKLVQKEDKIICNRIHVTRYDRSFNEGCALLI